MTYDINVRRDGPGNLTRLAVNGEGLDGDIVPLPDAGVSAVQVDVLLGDAGG